MWTAAACVLALAHASVSAQEAPCRGCTPDSTRTKTHVFPALGLRAGVPQKASVGIGVVFGVDWRHGGTDYSRDVAFCLEPGIGATRASVAYITGVGNIGSGFGVAATAMRTSARPWTFAGNNTYLGGEVLIWPVFLAGPRVGLFRRVSGDATMKRWYLSADFGFGL